MPNVIDILFTWIVNRDREFLEGGTTKATKPGTRNFPYFAAPNMDLQTVAETVDVSATPDKVWELIGQFGVAYLASSDRGDSRDWNRPWSIAHD